MSSMECVDVSTFIGREITTVLKMAMDNVILELCDPCDYFATIVVRKQINFQSAILRSERSSCCELSFNRMGARAYLNNFVLYAINM